MSLLATFIITCIDSNGMETIMNQTNRIIRSRFKLLFITWIGCYWGKHLKWLGYFEEAERIKSKHGHVLGWINPINLLSACEYGLVEITSVMFGKYRTDADGNLVRYIK